MILLYSLLIALAINLVLFGIAYKRQSDKLTDFSYALSFIAVAILAVILSDTQSLLLYIAVAMVVIWAIRLGGFLVYRIRKIGKDSRFDEVRGSFWKFLQFWLSQAVVAWVLLLPVLLLAGHSSDLTGVSYVGMAIWFIGLSLEAIADWQKFRFTSNPKNKGRWIDQGLWHFSRHPNYFGEICVWIGMYVMVVASLNGVEKWVGLVSPIVIFITLRYISGVPPLEKSADKKWGDKSDYQAYKKRTSLLIPWPPRV